MDCIYNDNGMYITSKNKSRRDSKVDSSESINTSDLKPLKPNLEIFRRSFEYHGVEKVRCKFM